MGILPTPSRSRGHTPHASTHAARHAAVTMVPTGIMVGTAVVAGLGLFGLRALLRGRGGFDQEQNHYRKCNRCAKKGS